MPSSNRTISGVDISVADEILRDLDDIELDKGSSHRRNSSRDRDSGHSSANESGLGRDVDHEKNALLKYVEDNVVGNDTWSPGPFGERKGENVR